MTDKLITIVRKWKYPLADGEYVALFPTEVANYSGSQCASFMLCGGYSGADYYGVIEQTKPVGRTMAEVFCAEMKMRDIANGCEITDYIIRRRATYEMHQERQGKAATFRKEAAGV